MRTLAGLGLAFMVIFFTGCGPCSSYCVASLESEPAASAAQPSPTLRVMSFNIRTRNPFDFGNGWGFRRDALTQTIRRFEPDVLGTQECRNSQARDLQKVLPEYDFVGAGRSDGDDGGEMCAIFYRRDKFSKLDEGHFWLSNTPEDEGSKDWGMFPRMVTWVKLTPRGGFEPFFLFNTHFDLNRTAQLRSAKILQERVSLIAGSSPVVVTGDFNTGEGSAPYKLLVGAGMGRGGRLVDTHRQADPTYDTPEGTRHGFRGGSGGHRIDWILASSQFKTLAAGIERYRHNGRLPSDHFPVTAVLQLPSRGVAMSRSGPNRPLVQATGKPISPILY